MIIIKVITIIIKIIIIIIVEIKIKIIIIANYASSDRDFNEMQDEWDDDMHNNKMVKSEQYNCHNDHR